MKSPFTGKEMKLVKEFTTLTYRKDQFKVLYHFYECIDTKERFTDDRLDEINQVQAHNQYREKYRIPFPEEIIEIRKKYGVSATKMSEILGLGANTYRLYEGGEMPSVANGRLILSVSDADEFIRQIKASSHILSKKEFEKYLASGLAVKKLNEENIWDRLFENHIFNNSIPNEYSGFKHPQLNKIAQVIAYLDGKIELYKTKLNKLLFYADFYYYKLTGYSITGITYRAIPYGPVPAEYDKLYVKLCDDEKICIQPKQLSSGDFAEVIKSKEELDLSSFSAQEIAVLDTVIEKFKNKTTKQIVDISHLEKAWSENQESRNSISYQKYAFDLMGVE